MDAPDRCPRRPGSDGHDHHEAAAICVRGHPKGHRTRADMAAVESVDLQAERAAELAEDRDKHDTKIERKCAKRKERRARQKAR
jgi:hypothetical protein